VKRKEREKEDFTGSSDPLMRSLLCHLSCAYPTAEIKLKRKINNDLEERE
jgi:hypothetical protein